MTPHADPVLAIASDCDASRAGDLLADLRDRVARATPDTPLSPDLTDGRPTALALQLLAATALSLTRAGAFAGFGPRAAAFLSPTTPRCNRQEA